MQCQLMGLGLSSVTLCDWLIWNLYVHFWMTIFNIYFIFGDMRVVMGMMLLCSESE